MATDLATIGIQVSSEQVATASSRLGTFTQSASKVDTATGKMNQQLKQTQSQMSATGSATASLTKLFRGLGIVMSIAYAVKTITDFEQSMASVRAVTRATNEEFTKLRDKAKELGANTRFTTAQAAEAMRYLGQAGLTTNEILVASQDVLRLAQAGGLGLADAAEIASKALRGFGLEATQMGEVADLMAKAFTASNTSVQELGEAFKYVAPVAKSFGVSMVDTTAAIAALSDAGISSTMAGSSLRNIMTKLANPTKQAEKALLDAGLTMDKLDIKSRGLIPVLESLANSTLTVEDAFTIFGQRGGPAFEVLKQAIPKIQKFSKEWQDLTGFAEETARIMDDNLQGALKRLVSALEYLMIQGTESAGLIKLAQSAIDGLAAAILIIVDSPITKWLDKILVGLAAYVAALKLAALWNKVNTGALGSHIIQVKLATANYGVAAGAATLYKNVLIGLRTVMMSLATNPMVWVAGLAAGIYALIQYTNRYKETLATFKAAFADTNVTLSDTNKELLKQKKLMQETMELDAATKKINEYEKALESVIGVFERAALAEEMMGNAATFAAGQQASMTNHLKKFGQVMTESTEKAAKVLNNFHADMSKTQDATEQLTLAVEAYNNLITLREQADSRERASIQKGIDLLVTRVGGTEALNTAIAEYNKLTNDKVKAEERSAKMGKELAAAMEQIDTFLFSLDAKKFRMPQDLNDAYDALENFTGGCKSAKESAWELEKQAALTGIRIYYQAAALAAVAGEFPEYIRLTNEAAKYQSQLNETIADYSKKNTPKGENKVEKFKENALEKQLELNLKIERSEMEIAGASQKTLALYQLQVDKQKELDDFKRRAPEGMQNSAEMQEIVRLTEKLYDLKEAVAKYEKAWEPVLQKQQDSIDLMDALGASSNKSSLELKKLQKEMLKANEFLNPEERVRQLNLIDAEIIKLEWDARFATQSIEELYAQYVGNTAGLMAAIQRANATEAYRHELYNTTIGQQNELLGQLDALKIAYDEGGISLDMYNTKFMEMQLQLAQLRQDMGESSFVDDVNLALSGIVEGYEGITKGLTNAWQGFFTSFTQGFSDSIGRAIMQGEDLGETLSNVAKDALGNLISQLIQLGIQWAVNAAISKAISASTTTSATAEGTAAAAALTEAWTPAATAASIASYGMASVAGTAGMLTALAVSKAAYALGGFKQGGFTGNVGTNEVAGLVHGGEYVMDAETVKNIGVDTLDSLRAYAGSNGTSGGSGNGTGMFSGTDTQLNVIIENYASGIKFDVEKLSESEVRVIAREEAEDVVNKETPKLMASEINNPSSKTSKALNQNYSSTRKH